MNNGDVYNIQGSTTIDLQNGAITAVPIYIHGPQTGITITFINCAPGVVVFLVLWNQTGNSFQLQLVASPDNGTTQVPFIVQSNSILKNLTRTSALVSSGTLHTAIGSLVSDEGEQHFLAVLL